MCITYQCVLEQGIVTFKASDGRNKETITEAEFDQLTSRRQRPKLSMATKMANGLFNFYSINHKLTSMGSDPKNTPLIICNRYANWDFVSESMCSDIATTINSVSNYVATAWFPATVQGFLTIENGNTGEAITLATKDSELLLAAIDGLFSKNSRGERQGCLIFGTFECLPKIIGGQKVLGVIPAVFGVISLISNQDSDELILSTITSHLEMYAHVKN